MKKCTIPPTHKDLLPGGLADDYSILDFNPRDLEEGCLVELEHSGDNVDLAIEIAMDHLVEDPDYYRKLKTIEKK